MFIPKRSTSRSAGYDFFSPFYFELLPGESIKIPTGIKAYMMKDEVLHIYPRSGLGFKYFLRPANLVAIIDSDYYNNEDTEGHIWVKVRNEGDTTVEIKKGMAFCQEELVLSELRGSAAPVIQGSMNYIRKATFSALKTVCSRKIFTPMPIRMRPPRISAYPPKLACNLRPR